jgi:hypothetical protein
LKGKSFGRLVAAVAAGAALMLGLAGTASASTQSVAHPSSVRPLDVGANLVSATITFTTTNDNKDSDSQLTVQVLNSSGVVKAQAIGFFGQFGNGSTNTVVLRVKPNVKFETLVGGTVRLGFQPNGDDTWKFGYDLSLDFSDSDFSETVEQNVVLSTDDNSHSHALDFS